MMKRHKMAFLRLSFLFTLLLLASPVLADVSESTVRSYDDYVLIKHIPSRGDHMKREAVRELKASTFTTQVKSDGKIMGTNEVINALHTQAKSLENGRSYPSGPYWQMEVSYMGDVVSLSNGVSRDSADINEAEQTWWGFYDRVFVFVTESMAPKGDGGEH